MLLTERTAGNWNAPKWEIGQSHHHTLYLVQDFSIWSCCIYTGIILLTVCCISKAFKWFIVKSKFVMSNQKRSWMWRKSLLTIPWSKEKKKETKKKEEEEEAGLFCSPRLQKELPEAQSLQTLSPLLITQLQGTYSITADAAWETVLVVLLPLVHLPLYCAVQLLVSFVFQYALWKQSYFRCGNCRQQKRNIRWMARRTRTNVLLLKMQKQMQIHPKTTSWTIVIG